MSRVASDILRIISALAVILIHATAYDERIFHHTLNIISSEFTGVFLNQVSRFCVPVFVILSGYGLTKSMDKFIDRPMGDFPVRKYVFTRFRKVAVPYVFLSFVFLLMSGRFDGIEVSRWPAVYLSSLLLGNADYHLYFLSIIIQSYILFPLLVSYINGTVLFLLFVLHLAVIYPVSELYSGYVDFPPASLVIYWIFYFYAGMYFAKNEARIILKIKESSFPLIAVNLVSIVFMLVEYYYRAQENPIPGYYNHFNRITVVFYFFTFFFLFVGEFQQGFENLKTKHGDRIARISALTFPVYLYHTGFIRLLEHTPIRNHTILLFFGTALLTFAAVFFLYRWMPDRFYLRMITAIPPSNRERQSKG